VACPGYGSFRRDPFLCPNSTKSFSVELPAKNLHLPKLTPTSYSRSITEAMKHVSSAMHLAIIKKIQ
jgi:hypothetical protein